MPNNWGFWEWLAYTGIWIPAIILAADLGLKMSPDLRKKFDHIITSPLWGFTPLILITISGAIFLGRETGLIGTKPISSAPPIVDSAPQIQLAPQPPVIPGPSQKQVLLDVTPDYLYGSI
jgi:hypothetical protein